MSARLHPVHVPRLLPPRPSPKASRARLSFGASGHLGPEVSSTGALERFTAQCLLVLPVVMRLLLLNK